MLNLINFIINIIKDFISVVMEGKDDKLKDAFNMLIRRIIAGLLVFFVPTIIGATLKTLDADMYAYNECILKATPEGIKNAYYKTAKQMVNDAKQSLDSNKYADAKAYLNNVDDPEKKKELEKELDKANEYII